MTTLHAQTMVLGHAGALGGTSSDLGRGIAVDGSGTTYITGVFQGTADFDPGTGVSNLTSAGSGDVFVVKLDASGGFVWARAFGGAGAEDAGNVAVDSSGNVVCVGYYAGTADFDPGAGVANLTSDGLSDIFVAKLDSAGNFLWTRSMGGTSNDQGHSIAADGSGNVYTTGAFQGTADFDPGAGSTLLTSGGANDAFVSKLDAAGNFQWVGAFSNASGAMGYDIVIDGVGDVVITGAFGGPTDFDPGAGTAILTATVGDAFVCKLSTAGAFTWAGAMGGSGVSTTGWDVDIDSGNNVYCGGWFAGTVDLDPGAGASNVTSAGSSDLYLCKLDATGAFLWGTATGGPSVDELRGVAVDGTGNVFTTGMMDGTVDFDPGVGTFILTAPSRNIFVQALDTSGNFRWAGIMVGTGASAGDGIDVDGAGNTYAAGFFNATVDFDPGTGTENLTPASGRDAFVVKLEPQVAPVAVADQGETDADQILTALTSPASNTVLNNDSDANTRDVLQVSAYDAISSEGAIVSMNPDGTFLYDPSGSPALLALTAGQSTDDTFTYTVTDGTGTAIATVTITVYGIGTGSGTALSALGPKGLALLVLLIALPGVWFVHQRLESHKGPGES